MSAKTEKKTAAAEATKTSTFDSIRENVSERASSVRETVGTVRDTAGQTVGAATDFGKAYYSGVTVLGQTLFGFGKEFYGEVTEHAQKTMKAKSLSEVAGLQAAFMQTRIETSAAHGKEFIDVARVQAEETMKPVIALLDGNRAA